MDQVPFVVAWTGEVGHVVRPEPRLGGLPALFADRGNPGEGRPKYSDVSEARQRQCAMGRLCGVCGQHIPIGVNGVALIISDAQEYELLDGAGLTEPLTCTKCLVTPLQRCPRIREAIELSQLMPLLVAVYHYQPIWYRRAELDNKPSVLSAMKMARVAAAVGMLALDLLDYKRLTIDELRSLAGLGQEG